ncbi:hypothetical protein SBV1_2980022 [Verrucomicrobia bacterium]|nr:hypothetical protein SBV1_2980022 [Verrucomicrobiota bacterium]
MARGNQGQPIYADDGDRKLWLCTLASRVCQQNSRISLRNLVYVDIMNARTPNTLLPSTAAPQTEPPPITQPAREPEPAPPPVKEPLPQPEPDPFQPDWPATRPTPPPKARIRR